MSSASTNLKTAAAATTDPQPAWKQEVNAKIAAARARRQAAQQSSGALKGEVLNPGATDSRTSRVAAAVAARYAQAPSYTEYIASEVRAAMTAAVTAAAEAQAAATRQYEAELSAARLAVASGTETCPTPAAPAPVSSAHPVYASNHETAPAPRTVVAPAFASSFSAAASSSAGETTRTSERQAAPPAAYVPSPAAIEDPLADALITPAVPLPAKLLEFPRELIAARKARPRHAEGPLRDEGREQPQLRIFEVEPEAISTTVEPVPHTTEWSSLQLDAYPAAYTAEDAVQTSADTISSTYSETYSGSGASPRHVSEHSYKSYAPPTARAYAHAHLATEAPLVSVASLEDRLMAAAVDGALIGIAFLLFAFVFAFSTVHPPTGRPAFIGSALVLGGLYLLYHALFFGFSTSTPGMLYARIALCTFDDENPTRGAMRKRIFALVLAAMPLGLGFLYALFDEEHLGWHDRMTRMYQRSYK